MADEPTNVHTDDVIDQLDVEGRVASDPGELPPFRPFNVIAVFDDISVSRDVVLDLERAGVEAGDISFLALDRDAPDDASGATTGPEDPVARQQDAVAPQTAGKAAKGGAAGTAIGAVTGALVAIAIPGVGPVLGAGVLGSAIGGGAFGGVAGGYWAGMSNLAASEAWTQTFTDVKNGSAVVGVHATKGDELTEATQVFRLRGARTVRHFDEHGHPVDDPTGDAG
ncbi:MAG: hypothetical protein S0880_04020 [Actinomycetota bacterium]|nr:hypothetical protein [Actinomycetota bacterium]